MAEREGAQLPDAEPAPVTGDPEVNRILAEFTSHARAAAHTYPQPGDPAGHREGEWVSGRVLAAAEAHRQLQERLSAGRG